MSTYSYVMVGKDVDEKFKKYSAVYEACEAAGLPAPKEVSEFFAELENKGEYDEKVIWQDFNAEEGGDDGRTFLTVDLTKLPDGVRYVRFINSY